MYRLYSILMLLILFGCSTETQTTPEPKLEIPLTEEERMELVNVRDDVKMTVYVNQFEHDGIRYIAFSERGQDNTQFMVDESYYMQSADTVEFAGRTWVAISPPIESIQIGNSKIPTVK